jgi:hypothetical protein
MIFSDTLRNHCAGSKFPIDFRKYGTRPEEAAVATARKTPVDTFRKRLRQKGMVRVEIHVQKDDAVLVKSVARALGDPRMAAEARTILKARFTKPAQAGLKALLASAPLEGVDLERPRDMGREIEL